MTKITIKITLFSLIMFALGIISCKKDTSTDPANPDTTDDGSYVSFKVDNLAYGIKGVLAYGTNLSTQTGVYALYNPDNSGKEDDRLLYFLIDKTKGVGTYLLKSNTTDKGIWIVGDGATDDQEFFTYNDTAGGVVQITQKTDELIEGTFSFSAATFNATKKVYITDGKFSVKMR